MAILCILLLPLFTADASGSPVRLSDSCDSEAETSHVSLLQTALEVNKAALSVEHAKVETSNEQVYPAPLPVMERVSPALDMLKARAGHPATGGGLKRLYTKVYSLIQHASSTVMMEVEAVQKANQNVHHKTKDSSTMTMLWIGAAIVLCVVGYQISVRSRGVAVLESDSGQMPASKLVAEFVGTYMLIFCVGCNVIVGNSTWAVTSIACTLMVCIYTFASVSGANFNPAVSVCLGLTNKLPWSDAFAYISVQLAAGLAASVSYGLVLGHTTTLGPSTGFSWIQAGFAELLYTFMLTFVVLNAATSKIHGGKDQFYGLAIGFVVVAGGYGAGSISGGCFNPAVALGVWSSSPTGIASLLEYWIFEVLGCAAAASLYRMCRPEDIPGSDSDGSTHPLFSKCVSEFLGTFFLVLTVGLNVLGNSQAGAFSIAASLMCMIYALGSVSGGHFNPAVTTAILHSGRDIISGREALAYMCAQCLGSLSAAFSYSILMNGRSVPLAPGDGYGLGQALAGEFAFTFLLCLTVLGVATIKSSPQPQFFGLAIGSCVTAGGFAVGNVSGGSLNPAVTAGLALSNCIISGGPVKVNGFGFGYHSRSLGFSNMFLYGVVEFLAGVVAAQVLRVTHAEQLSKSSPDPQVTLSREAPRVPVDAPAPTRARPGCAVS